MVRVSGISPPTVLLAFDNDITTLECAVKERVFFVKDDEGTFISPPLPEPGHFARCLSGTRQLLNTFLPNVAPLTRLQFVETFRGRKRKMYQDAYDSLLGSSLTVDDAGIVAFVKYEKTDFSKKKPVPRVISPRSPRYNIEVGRYLRAIEERLFKALGQLFGHVTVFKGMNASTSGRTMHQKWGMFKNPVAVGADAKRMDQHVSKDALVWEHETYLPCFRTQAMRRRLSHLLSHQLANKCRGYCADGKLKYKTVGGRMSGDMNTSLGNCVLMCAMIHAYAASIGVRIQLANNGDDCVIFMEQEDLERFLLGFEDWFHRMGFTMVVEPPCYIFEEIEFCQTHPIFVGPNFDDYIMVRNPRTALAKDTMCVSGWQSGPAFSGWVHAVGTGGLSMTGQVPVFQEFYKSYVASGNERKSASDLQSWGVRQLAKGMKRSYGPILPATRASFYWAFGITPCEQLVMEEFYRGMRVGNELVKELAYQTPLPW